MYLWFLNSVAQVGMSEILTSLLYFRLEYIIHAVLQL